MLGDSVTEIPERVPKKTPIHLSLNPLHNPKTKNNLPGKLRRNNNKPKQSVHKPNIKKQIRLIQSDAGSEWAGEI